MSVRTRQYVIVGVDVGYHWDERPDDDDDAWLDRHEDEMFGLYTETKKPGDNGILKDAMSTRYCIIGKLLAVADEEGALSLAMTDYQFAEMISEVGNVLFQKYDITTRAKLHILTHNS